MVKKGHFDINSSHQQNFFVTLSCGILYSNHLFCQCHNFFFSISDEIKIIIQWILPGNKQNKKKHLSVALKLLQFIAIYVLYMCYSKIRRRNNILNVWGKAVYLGFAYIGVPVFFATLQWNRILEFVSVIKKLMGRNKISENHSEKQVAVLSHSFPFCRCSTISPH